ncbi:hypothetical protein [Andreprevotia chitinilytica]|uniref:hypothetical protein n=1 Tax=Andreprevotia chitinilytica TaxID=396808 RepID=UPI000550A13B|nr:hypothetical protein [Andreprevotia chitinilytica]
MKKTDLEKNQGLKINNTLRNSSTPDRFGKAGMVDRREQRKLDQAAGLVPFAVKLNGDLVKTLHEQAAAQGVTLNELVGKLLQNAVDAG